MILNENLKLIIIGLLGVATSIQARAVTTGPEETQVEKIPDKWMCDMIECPLNSHRCFVSQINEEPSVLQRVNICFDENNTILAQKNVSSPTDPNYRIREYSNTYRNGRFLTINEGTQIKDVKQQLNETTSSGMKNLSPNIQNMIKDIEKQIQKEIKGWTDTLNMLHVSGKFSQIALNMPK